MDVSLARVENVHHQCDVISEHADSAKMGNMSSRQAQWSSTVVLLEVLSIPKALRASAEFSLSLEADASRVAMQSWQLSRLTTMTMTRRRSRRLLTRTTQTLRSRCHLCTSIVSATVMAIT